MPVKKVTASELDNAKVDTKDGAMENLKGVRSEAQLNCLRKCPTLTTDFYCDLEYIPTQHEYNKKLIACQKRC